MLNVQSYLIILRVVNGPCSSKTLEKIKYWFSYQQEPVFYFHATCCLKNKFLNERSLTYLCFIMRQRDENKILTITEKAIEMIADDGLENFGINKLARAAGVSPATIYIYYKDKEDLLTQLSVEVGKRISQGSLKGLEPDTPFENGLWLQWQNRAKYAMTNKRYISCGDQFQHSNYREMFTKSISSEMRRIAGPFFKNAVERGEIHPMPIEIYWSVAFAPLYTMVRWHKDGYSLDGRSFTLTPKIMREAFELVIKAFKK